MGKPWAEGVLIRGFRTPHSGGEVSEKTFIKSLGPHGVAQLLAFFTVFHSRDDIKFVALLAYLCDT